MAQKGLKTEKNLYTGLFTKNDAKALLTLLDIHFLYGYLRAENLVPVFHRRAVKQGLYHW